MKNLEIDSLNDEVNELVNQYKNLESSLQGKIAIALNEAKVQWDMEWSSKLEAQKRELDERAKRMVMG